MDLNFDTTIAALTPTIDAGFVATILGKVFGFNSPVFIPYSWRKKFNNISDYKGIEVVSDEEADRLSQFGTPVLGSFFIEGGPYKVFDNDGNLVNKTFPSFEFPVATLVDFSRSKNIIKTPMTGGSGTVKEIFSLDDWAISIKGLCINDTSRKGQTTAGEQADYIRRFNEVVEPLNIKKGSLFLQKGISKIVLETLSFPSMQGKPDVIPFEITASSDTDILLFS